MDLTLKQRQKRLERIQARKAEGKTLSAPDEAFLTEEALRRQKENIRDKALDGQVLTARQEAALAQSTIGAPAAADSGFAATWDELAVRLNVTRQSIGKWRARFAGECPRDRPDGRKNVSAWAAFMRARNLAGGMEDDDDGEEGVTKGRAYWQEQNERLKVEDRKDAIGIRRRTLLPAADLERAFGQMLVGLRTALNNLPVSTARWLVGQRDFHVIREILQGAVDSIFQGICQAFYLEEILPRIVEDLDLDPEASAAIARLTFAGEDRPALNALVVRLAMLALNELGRLAIVEITGPSANASGDDTPEPPEESQSTTADAVADAAPALVPSAASAKPNAAGAPPGPPKAARSSRRKVCSSERAFRKDTQAEALAEIPAALPKATKSRRKGTAR